MTVFLRKTINSVQNALRQFWILLLFAIGLLTMAKVVSAPWLSQETKHLIEYVILFCSPLAIWWITKPLRRMAASEHLLASAVIASASDGIILTDENGIIQLLNPSAERIFGYTSDEILGKQVSQLVPNSHVRILLRAAYQNETKESSEIDGLHKDGRTIPLDLSVSCVRDNGELRYVGIVRDITSRKLADQRLRESEAMQSAIIQASPDMMLLFHEDGTCIDVLAGREKLLLPMEQILDKKISEFAPAELAEQGMAGIKRVLDGKLTDSLEVAYDAPTGHYWFEARLVAVRPANKVIAIVRDITKQKQLEQEVLEVISRSKHLEGMQHVAVTLQHEINNPLTAVLGNAQLLTMKIPELKDCANAEQLADLQLSATNIMDLAQRIAAVVHRLKHVYEPVVTVHPITSDLGVQMIDLKDSK
jgi:PAS domain S-box-containing protein